MIRSALAIAVALAVVIGIPGCSRPIKAGRTSPSEPPSLEEQGASARLSHRKCSPNFALLFPGAGQLCSRKSTDGTILAGLATAEIGAAIAAGTQVELALGESALEHPAVAIPLIAVQDLWVYGIADTYIDKNLAAGAVFTPRDSLTDLAAAPFNLQVMKRPKVLLGLAGMLALGLGVTFAVSEIDTSRSGRDPNLFGRTVSPGLGYPLAGATFAGLFTHVAIAEEALFRGVVQSGLARSQGELGGLVYGSLIFGAAHAPNALTLEGDDRRDYVLYALPTITAIGAYLSYLYMDADYSLAPSTAVHFWYDFLLSAVSFAIEPDNSILSATVGWSF